LRKNRPKWRGNSQISSDPNGCGSVSSSRVADAGRRERNGLICHRSLHLTALLQAAFWTDLSDCFFHRSERLQHVSKTGDDSGGLQRTPVDFCTTGTRSASNPYRQKSRAINQLAKRAEKGSSPVDGADLFSWPEASSCETRPRHPANSLALAQSLPARVGLQSIARRASLAATWLESHSLRQFPVLFPRTNRSNGEL
jgi:hypothetical protein